MGVSMEMHLLIPTAGRPGLFARLIDSLLASSLPESLRSVVVVENGSPSGAEAVCERVSGRLPIRYRRTDRPCKSAALNAGLEGLDDSSLAVMTDDDVRFEAETLLAYERSAAESDPGWFFGGPFSADYESAPNDWLLPYLPPSACGWSPGIASFDPARDRFYGCNWAARVGDLRAIGGFDPRYGPGSARNSTGQETEAQRRLQANGLLARLVPEARVWHWVPESRCSPAWALDRARRNGVARGIRVRSRNVANGVANHVMNAIRFTAAAAESLVVGTVGERRRFDAEYRRQKAAGYFEGFNKAA